MKKKKIDLKNDSIENVIESIFAVYLFSLIEQRIAGLVMNNTTT